MDALAQGCHSCYATFPYYVLRVWEGRSSLAAGVMLHVLEFGWAWSQWHPPHTSDLLHDMPRCNALPHPTDPPPTCLMPLQQPLLCACVPGQPPLLCWMLLWVVCGGRGCRYGRTRYSLKPAPQVLCSSCSQPAPMPIPGPWTAIKGCQAQGPALC